MTTYYGLFCNACDGRRVDFVTRLGDRFVWVAQTEVTMFMRRHASHISSLEIISDADPRWWNEGADEDADDGIRRDPDTEEA
jgi:hypothetical protein